VIPEERGRARSKIKEQKAKRKNHRKHQRGGDTYIVPATWEENFFSLLCIFDFCYLIFNLIMVG